MKPRQLRRGSSTVVFGVLAYGSVHRITDSAIHALQHVAVGVERLARWRRVSSTAQEVP